MWVAVRSVLTRVAVMAVMAVAAVPAVRAVAAPAMLGGQGEIHGPDGNQELTACRIVDERDARLLRESVARASEEENRNRQCLPLPHIATNPSLCGETVPKRPP